MISVNFHSTATFLDWARFPNSIAESRMSMYTRDIKLLLYCALKGLGWCLQYVRITLKEKFSYRVNWSKSR